MITHPTSLEESIDILEMVSLDAVDRMIERLNYQLKLLHSVRLVLLENQESIDCPKDDAPLADMIPRGMPQYCNKGEQNRLKFLLYLRQNGPSRQSVIIHAVQLSTGSVCEVLKSNWFRRQKEGSKVIIHLTEEGIKYAEANGY